MMNKIYIVKEHGGYSSDSFEHNICAFPEEDDAKRCIDTMSRYNEWWLSKAQRILDEFQPKMYSSDTKYNLCYDLQMEIYDRECCYYTYEEIELKG